MKKTIIYKVCCLLLTMSVGVLGSLTVAARELPVEPAAANPAEDRALLFYYIPGNTFLTTEVNASGVALCSRINASRIYLKNYNGKTEVTIPFVNYRATSGFFTFEDGQGHYLNVDNKWVSGTPNGSSDIGFIRNASSMQSNPYEHMNYVLLLINPNNVLDLSGKGMYHVDSVADYRETTILRRSLHLSEGDARERWRVYNASDSAAAVNYYARLALYKALERADDRGFDTEYYDQIYENTTLTASDYYRTAQLVDASVLPQSEYIVQALPFRTTAGVETADEQSMSFVMRNPALGIRRIQMDCILPEGIRFHESDPFVLTSDRIPYSESHGVKTLKYHVSYTQPSTNLWRIVIEPLNTDEPIGGNDGVVMKAYFTTSSPLANGVYPIRVCNAVMTTNDAKNVELEESTSYFVVGESGLTTEGEVDLSDFQGYLPTFVVDSLNTELILNTTLTSIDITAVTSTGHTLTVQNANALVLRPTESEISATQGNHVTVNPYGVASCAHLILDEEGGPFRAPRAFTATSVTLKRTLLADRWNTLCLPFSLPYWEVSTAFGSKPAVFRGMVSDSRGNKALRFEESNSGITANRPVLLQPAADGAEYTFSNVTVAATDGLAVEVGDYALQGTYSGGFVVPVGDYYISNGHFYRSQGLSTIAPFRAWLRSIGGGVKTERLSFFVSEPTGMAEMPKDEGQDETVCDLMGRRVQGRLRPGLYVRGGRVITVK